MQNNSEPNAHTSVARRKRQVAVSIAGLLVLLGLIAVVIPETSMKTMEPPTIVIRVDDIQDFAFTEGQLFLLSESVANRVPVSLAVIAGDFGQDSEVVQAVKLAISLGSEVAVHGWKHEDLAKLSFSEQVALLAQSRSRIREILDFDTRVLVPPMFSFNEDTIAAMHDEGYNIISASSDLTEPGSISEVISLPATVELSNYLNGTWRMKSLDSVEAEISKSIQKYGFAVILTHPQEFISADGKLNQVNTQLFRSLLRTLKQNYSFRTLERLGEDWRK